MDRKSKFRNDSRAKRSIFFQIGLLAAFSLVLTAFELKQYEKPFMLLPDRKPGTTLTETVINTKQEQPKAQQQPARPTPTVIEIVGDKSDIIGDLHFTVDILPGGNLPSYQLPKRKGEQEVPDPPIERFPDIYASYRGGEAAMYQFLMNNLVYPPIAKAARLEGTVFIQFVVEKDGSISNIEVAQGGVGGGCEEAAIDVINKMPSWNPGRQRNRPVRSYFVLPIKFQLVN
jgi:periplasmic protein TonB